MKQKDDWTPRDRDWYLRLSEDPNAAREFMADILARVDARMAERRAHNERNFFRRLFAR